MTPTPLQAHLFRAAAPFAIGATLIAAGGLLIAAFIIMRGHMTEHYRHAAMQAANTYFLYENTPSAGVSLAEAGAMGGFTQLCIYNTQNTPVAKWEQQGACPALMIERHSKTHAFTLELAEPVQRAGTYHGMVYAVAEFTSLRTWMVFGAALLLGLLPLCWGALQLLSRRCAQLIAAQLAAIGGQVECFKHNGARACEIPPARMLAETAELSRALIDLRSHMDLVSVPRDAMASLKHWHWEIVAELLATLRQRLDPDSPLLENVSDYALLMQSERGDTLPPARSFDLAELLDEATVSARRAHPGPSQINLTISLQAGTPRIWLGQPELLRGLLRHLLLIGLSRTRTGFVCLRLHAASDYRLHIAYEDSGPAIQHWQLAQWLAPIREETPGVSMTDNVSWLLASRLFRRLGGDVTGASKPEGGLSLEGSLPLQVSRAPQLSASRFVSYSHARPPLVLVVEGAGASVGAMLARAGCETFTVRRHAEAVEWATTLPFSMILLNLMQDDANEDMLRRLRHRREEGLLPRAAIWAVTDSDSAEQRQVWRLGGVSEMLLMPLRPEPLRQLCAELAPRDGSYFMHHSDELRQDFTPSLTDALPHMEQMLCQQVQALLPLLEQAAGGNAPGLAHEAHGVKSAALGLGYFRLAGLMGQIEQTAARSLPPEGWRIVAACLAGMQEQEGIKTPPSAPPHRRNDGPDQAVRQAG